MGLELTTAISAAMPNWRSALNQNWHALRFGDLKIESDAQQHVFEMQVFLNELEPTSVQVELYADGGAAGLAVWPATDFTARLIPHHHGVAIPLADARIL